ncbi:hypothetical protein JF66_03930 [Cryobacterium sp. MLB-32]|uniref:MFS transporter n=1 Tax=Cryobacterium sp. MLB-32 TaxID=1529318 RepID=UPI0004E61271|nr:MFS transporter [Cryobacterium sp. MLB-32]KFF60511.1 hypothetical protein JF66_03930 [Cryobacterium sp. MLB-32]
MTAPDAGGPRPETPPWSAWRVVMGFGVVSLVVDLSSNGAQSIFGPLLGQLGASAFVVGVIVGLGEGIALAFRLVSGPISDRTGRYWGFTLAGYLLTAVCVPLLAVTPLVGSAGLVLASALILLERTGKAVRSPAKTVLLANAAGAVGRGRGFAVHKSLDQVGSLLGPLIVAGVIAATGLLSPAFALMVVPGALAMGLLLWIRARVPDMSIYERADDRAAEPEPVPGTVRRLPTTFYLLATSVSLSTAGLVSFGVISFHLIDAGLLNVAAVPLVYAAAMGAAALAALISGYAYDKWGARVLFALPALICCVPGLALSVQLSAVVVGTVIAGMASGIQESTVKALVADLIPSVRRGTAYGIFAAFEGGAALCGGILAGALYNRVGLLMAVVAVLQVLAATMLFITIRLRERLSAPRLN